MRSLAAVLLLSPAVAAAATSFDVCTEPLPSGESSDVLRAGFTAWEDANVTEADIGRENWLLDVAFTRPGGWQGGGAYRGTLLDESDIGLQTNGYLHSFYFFLQRLRNSDSGLRLAVAPALSGSSNVTKDPDEWESDAWQLHVAAVWRWPAHGAVAWRAGLCADHRFGGYQLYPVVAYEWRPHRDWQVAAGVPDASITFRPADAVELALAIYPNGNEWFVKDATLTQSSLLEYRAWAVDLAVTWHVAPSVALEATAGVDAAAEYRATLADGTRATLDAGTVARVGIEFAWAF